MAGATGALKGAAVATVATATAGAVIATATAINRGSEALYSVYRSVTGGKEYFGITNNLPRRASEHRNGPYKMEIEAIVVGLDKMAAQGLEQVLIELHGMQKNGGKLLNQRNSISPKNKIYQEAKKRGQELLETLKNGTRTEQP